MTRTLLSITLLAAALAPAVAHAGPAEQAAKDLEPYFMWVPGLRAAPAQYAHASLPDAKKCHAAGGTARKAGLAADAKIYSSYLRGWDETRYDDQQQPYLQLGEVAAVCDEYAGLLAMIPAVAAQQEASQWLRVTAQHVDPAKAGSGRGMLDAAKKCLDATDAAIAAGAPADRKTTIDGQELTLAEGRAQICVALQTFAGGFYEASEEAHAAERKKRAEKFEKAGIKGERLELFVKEYDTVWRGKGCARIDDLKKLKKAKVLYSFSINDDGSYVVWKVTFKGDKVKSTTSRTYKNEAAAYKGCK